jgi:hypothetical protein
MSFESSNQLGGWDCARDALAEIASFHDELKILFTGLFDQMGQLNNELLVQEVASQRTEHQVERDALQGQVDRLAAIAAELSGVVAEQKKTQGNRSDV